jgi:molybdopterin-containing oxidoreductase family membrane subunit
MPPTTETVVGVFAHVDTTVKALEELRAKGYHELEVYTPAPVHEIEEVMERGRPVSRVRLFTLIGGLTGTASGFILTIWSAMQWGLVTGGKPVASIPPFVVIAFELTILFGGLSTVLGMILLGRLPRLWATPAYDPRFSNDRFGVAVRCAAGRGDSVSQILRAAGAEEVKAA